MKICVCYSDALGVCRVSADMYGVAFLDGFAVFEDCDGNSYKIPVSDLIEILPE